MNGEEGQRGFGNCLGGIWTVLSRALSLLIYLEPASCAFVDEFSDFPVAFPPLHLRTTKCSHTSSSFRVARLSTDSSSATGVASRAARSLENLTVTSFIIC